ncbi:hypothetical protein [Thermomonospora umbrina]|uniref:hypothetical protein n=1 Tax=Thermomonospora umbrina TaxID=111806 RepID=UPI0011C153B7|nr:hypothetical protein [Thermomonospora umbrina]
MPAAPAAQFLGAVPPTSAAPYSKNLVQVAVDLEGKRRGKTGALIATDIHPFWIPTTQRWTDAGEPKTGMWLRTSVGTHVQITAIKTWTAYRQVARRHPNVDRMGRRSAQPQRHSRHWPPPRHRQQHHGQAPPHRP